MVFYYSFDLHFSNDLPSFLCSKSRQFFSQNSSKDSKTLGTKVSPYDPVSALSPVTVLPQVYVPVIGHNIIFCSRFKFFQ